MNKTINNYFWISGHCQQKLRTFYTFKNIQFFEQWGSYHYLWITAQRKELLTDMMFTGKMLILIQIKIIAS